MPPPRLLADGLTLFEDVLPAPEQRALLAAVERWLSSGRRGALAGKAYQRPPDEWLRSGQSRETIQFGAYVKCNKVSHAAVPPLPAELARLLERLEAAAVFTAAQRPDSCCVNVYEPGCWLPPHVDSAAFDRPFFTLSLASAQRVVFGEHIGGERGEWHGELSVLMPEGSVLRLDGLAAGPWKHALPRATRRRVSLTFRKLGAESRARFEAIRQASAEAAEARRARCLAKKALRGRKPRVVAGEAGARLLWAWTMREHILARQSEVAVPASPWERRSDGAPGSCASAE
ncbi:hypothetical protein AB1Y20_007656 [Prymnesium parvum]|uniref:Fe2OG dioxygenase domain-containing protein n=1 Tax=Prymnesium parvum TaxID=97485 RepID=A0AB34IVU4_PRYPA